MKLESGGQKVSKTTSLAWFAGENQQQSSHTHMFAQAGSFPLLWAFDQEIDAKNPVLFSLNFFVAMICTLIIMSLSRAA